MKNGTEWFDLLGSIPKLYSISSIFILIRRSQNRNSNDVKIKSNHNIHLVLYKLFSGVTKDVDERSKQRKNKIKDLA